MITIDLTEDDALLFRAFRQHQDNFSTLLARGVFNVRGGKAIINFDPEGVISEIKFDITGYKRGLPPNQFLHLA